MSLNVEKEGIWGEVGYDRQLEDSAIYPGLFCLCTSHHLEEASLDYFMRNSITQLSISPKPARDGF